MASGIEVVGLQAYVRPLRGTLFKDVNKELRQVAKRIATGLQPQVVAAVKQSGAPQAEAMAATVRVHSDRVPVLSVGKVNPRFRSGFRRSAQSAKASKMRRGALAHGVVYGPKGGRRDTPAHENYYRIRRDNSGGPVGAALKGSGPVIKAAQDAYLDEYLRVLRRHGFVVGRMKGGLR